MTKMNKTFIIKNRYTMNGRGKGLVCPFNSQEFWKFIGCILSVITYGNKVQQILREKPKHSSKMAPTKLQRHFCGKIDLYKVFCA